MKKWLLLIILLILLSGCTKSGSPINESTAEEPTSTMSTPEVSSEGESPPQGDSTTPSEPQSEASPWDGSVRQLESPNFLQRKEFALCKLAQDYLTLDDNAFSKKYSPENLWKQGAFDRLLFTDRYQEPVIAGISVGDSIKDVVKILGEPQFAPKQSYGEDYHRYQLIGYKTKDFYFAFQSNSSGVIESICLRKRIPLPKDKADILSVMARNANWWEQDNSQLPDWQRCFTQSPIKYTQWGRGSMSLICDYGFVSTSGMFGDTYSVYADFEGEVPCLPMRSDTSDAEPYNPIFLYETDYPEQLIYNIYTYLAQVEAAVESNRGYFSPNANIFAFTAPGADPLDMTSSELYENAHVILHWMDGSQPDRSIRFGHFSTLIGFPSDRYLLETNMMGVHAYDLQTDQSVYEESDVFSGRSDLRLDRVNCRILDSNNQIWYRYSFTASGELNLKRLQDYE